MAKRKNGNGHDVTQADILRVLERIERNTDETRAEVTEVRGDLKSLNARLDAILEKSARTIGIANAASLRSRLRSS